VRALTYLAVQARLRREPDRVEELARRAGELARRGGESAGSAGQ
jgi:hypothetical protein